MGSMLSLFRGSNATSGRGVGSSVGNSSTTGMTTSSSSSSTSSSQSTHAFQLVVGQLRPLFDFAHRGFQPSQSDVIVARLILQGLVIRRHRNQPKGGGDADADKVGSTDSNMASNSDTKDAVADEPEVARLPPELALHILSLAAYHPVIKRSRTECIKYNANDNLRPGPRADVAGLYLTSPPIPQRGVSRVKWITFQMRAADQGWATFGGEGTYNNSHTWFEASILRPFVGTPDEARSGPLPSIKGGCRTKLPLEYTIGETFKRPGKACHALGRRYFEMVPCDGARRALCDGTDKGPVSWMVHHNITARATPRDYRVHWGDGSGSGGGAGAGLDMAPLANHIDSDDDPRVRGDGEGFLDLLEPGDVVALWARAEQAQWVNKVYAATIEIGYET